MQGRLISRRSMIAGSAAAVALMSTGVLSMQDWLTSKAHAEEASKPSGEEVFASTCNACSSKCGMFVHVRDGKLWKLVGNKDHPYSKGMLCPRGHGSAQIVYSEDRLTSPMKRNEDGSFSAISWDQAYKEIGDKLKGIVAKSGPESVSIITDPRPIGQYYSQRFINALGSPNYYTHNATCNGSLAAGYTVTFGTNNFSADVSNAKVVVFLGRSYADGIRPSAAKNLADAAEKGTKIVIVDPRYNNSAVFASQWIPINPGTDLALLLAISHVLVKEKLYDKDFVTTNSIGFDEWAPELEQYTPKWAAEITGIDAKVIETLAKDLGTAGHAGVIEQSWRAAFGCQHQNSYETARCVAAVNALLGNYNHKGGAGLYPTAKLGKLDETKFPKIPEITIKKVGLAEYPLQSSGQGIVNIVAAKAKEGKMKAAFFYHSNAIKCYGNPKDWQEGMEAMDLTVCIDVQMSETAQLCDYVLAECSYLERLELPQILGGKQNMMDGRFKALEIMHPDTLPGDEIFVGLAKASGIGEYFNFTIDELVKAQVKSMELDIDELAKKGVLKIGEAWDKAGEPVTFATPSTKFEFAASKIAGMMDKMVMHKPTIAWIPPKVTPKEGEFRLIGGKQSIHSHTMTTSIEALMNITKEYNLERIWIPAAKAKELGISEGDTVEVSNELYSGKVKAHVTERLNPTCVWIPTHYGGSSSYLKQGYQFGIPHMEFVPFDFEPDVGPPMTHEVIVTVKKVSA